MHKDNIIPVDGPLLKVVQSLPVPVLVYVCMLGLFGQVASIRWDNLCWPIFAREWMSILDAGCW